MRKPINIPETREYGWILQDSGKRVFKSTKKSFWNRIRYIVEQRGGKLLPKTMGFTMEGGDFDEEDMAMIREEMARTGVIEMPEDIELDKDGREQPNFGDNPLESI